MSNPLFSNIPKKEQFFEILTTSKDNPCTGPTSKDITLLIYFK
jgi:hypothetical protein